MADTRLKGVSIGGTMATYAPLGQGKATLAALILAEKAYSVPL
jgi:hypothetical protein